MENNINYKKDALLNTIGNFAYLGALWLMTVLIVRLTDFENAGLFSLAITSANIYISLASYTVRIYYASDINNRFSDSQYVLMRFFSTGLSIILCIVCTLIAGYNKTQFIVILLFYLYKSAEMGSDILFGTMQRHGKLYYCGYSLTLKSVLSLIAFIITLIFTKNLILALAIMCVLSFLQMFLLDLPLTRKASGEKISFKISDIKPSLKIFIICFPIFITGLCFNIVPSMPRLIFEKMYSTEELGYYSSIATITVLISTAANCILAPLVPKFAQFFKFKDKYGLSKITFGSIGVILLAGIVFLIFERFLGDWGLNLIFGNEILPYSYIFKWAIIAAVLTSVIVCFNNFFVAADKQNIIMFASIICALLCVTLSFPLCKYYYMMGITVSLIISQLIEIIILTAYSIKIIKNLEKVG